MTTELKTNHAEMARIAYGLMKDAQETGDRTAELDFEAQFRDHLDDAVATAAKENPND